MNAQSGRLGRVLQYIVGTVQPSNSKVTLPACKEVSIIMAKAYLQNSYCIYSILETINFY